MANLSNFQTLGERIIPPNNHNKFRQLLQDGNLRQARQMIEKWIPDAVRTKRVEGSEEFFFETLSNLQLTTQLVSSG